MSVERPSTVPNSPVGNQTGSGSAAAGRGLRADRLATPALFAFQVGRPGPGRSGRQMPNAGESKFKQLRSGSFIRVLGCQLTRMVRGVESKLGPLLGETERQRHEGRDGGRDGVRECALSIPPLLDLASLLRLSPLHSLSPTPLPSQPPLHVHSSLSPLSRSILSPPPVRPVLAERILRPGPRRLPHPLRAAGAAGRRRGLSGGGGVGLPLHPCYGLSTAVD